MRTLCSLWLGILALCCTAVMAAEIEPVLMGYSRLDGAGLPKDVRVALSRARFTALWSAAHPEDVTAPPIVDLATGAPQWRIAARDDGMSVMADVRLPIAVLNNAWHQVRVPVPAGTVATVSVEALGADNPLPDAGRITWQGDGSAMVFSIAGHTQAILVMQLSLPLRLDGGQYALSLPILPGGGDLTVQATAGWEPVSPHTTFVDDGKQSFHTNFPVLGTTLDLRLRRRDVAAPREVHLSLEQRLVVALLPDRLQWTADLTLAIQGGTLRETRLQLPDDLALATVDCVGLAGWRQHGKAVDLTWTIPVSGRVTIHATGILARRGADVAVTVDCPDAERSRGRLGLIGNGETGQRSERLLTSDDPALSRAEPQADEDVAVQWDGRLENLRIRWHKQDKAIRTELHAAVRSDSQRVQIAVKIGLAGRGSIDGLRLHLPPPWRLLRTNAPGHIVDASFVGDGPERLLVLQSSIPFAAGQDLALWLDADRALLGTDFDLPDLWPVDGLAAERQLWLVGDAGDQRLRLRAAANLNDSSTVAMAREFASELPAGSTWRQAVERRAGPVAHAELISEIPRVSISVSHYLVLEADRLRWSAHLVFTPEQGELNELVCQLPPGARLVRSAGRDLGALHIDADGRLVARLAAPASGPTTLDLDLEMPVGDDATVRVAAIAAANGDLLRQQQVVLVEDYELGMVHRQIEGLDAQADLLMPLPDGVDATQVKLRWQAQRPAWLLTLRREPLLPAGGIDGIATQIDAYSAIAPDGEFRSRALWHVLNRSRQQLRLSVPAQVELWEVRVDGRPVSCRRDPNDAAVVWVPVKPLRPGEAARRVELTWRQSARADATRLLPVMPLFTELKIMQSLWRFSPPNGWQVERRDGTLNPIAASDADGERAKRVVEELSRLRNQGELKDNALLRCNDQLDQLELELSDYNVQLKTIGSTQVAEIDGQLGQLRDDRQRNSAVYGNRAGNRKALSIGKRTRDWGNAAADPSTTMIALAAITLPWREALTVESRTGLPDGAPPPGHRAFAERTLLGIDLVGDAPATLNLRGNGGDLSVELDLQRPQTSWWPSLAGALAFLAMLALAVFVQRR